MLCNDKTKFKSTIRNFVAQSSGLSLQPNKKSLVLNQHVDNKHIAIDVSDVEEIIHRMDPEECEFLQINFSNNKKILLTDTMVGFKPAYQPDLEAHRLPRVVTTMDLIGVIEALEENINTHHFFPHNEIVMLRKVFQCVLEGGEAVGFNLEHERTWPQRIAQIGYKPRA